MRGASGASSADSFLALLRSSPTSSSFVRSISSSAAGSAAGRFDREDDKEDDDKEDDDDEDKLGTDDECRETGAGSGKGKGKGRDIGAGEAAGNGKTIPTFAILRITGGDAGGAGGGV